MYVFDTNVFYTLGNYYPSRFPTIWSRLDELAESQTLRSVKEVRKELEKNCPFAYVSEWVKANRHIFHNPNDDELAVVAEIFKKVQYQGLIKKRNIIKGQPAADPFVIAAAKVHDGIVVTQEKFKVDGARIPTVCEDFEVQCIDLEKFLEYEELEY